MINAVTTYRTARQAVQFLSLSLSKKKKKLQIDQSSTLCLPRFQLFLLSNNPYSIFVIEKDSFSFQSFLIENKREFGRK